MTSQRRRLLELIKETSFKQSEAAIFHLASGIDSRFYVDCKQALSLPEARKLIGELIFERVHRDAFDAIGGLEIGAYPIATSVSDKIFDESGKSVRVFVVRKEAKKHGIRKLVAGFVKSGDRALIVDDVITSGSSAIQAIRSAREEGLIVNRVIALVDREESDGKANIERENVRFEALFSLDDLIKNELHSDENATARSDSPGIDSRQSARLVATR